MVSVSTLLQAIIQLITFILTNPTKYATFQSHAADNDQNKNMSQDEEGRQMDAHLGSTELQKAQNFAVTSGQLIIQKEEPEKEESPRFYSISNPTDASRTVQRPQPYKCTIKFMVFKWL